MNAAASSGPRVLQALSGGDLGGTERMVQALVLGLRARGVVCEVSVLDRPGRITAALEAADVVVHSIGVQAGTAAKLLRFRRLLRAGRFDVVHLYGFRMALLGRSAAGFRGRPALVHGIRGLHVANWPETTGFKTAGAIALERVFARITDVYAANSQTAADFLCSRGLPKHKFIVIPNGVNWSVNVPNDAPPADGCTIACVANHRPHKSLGDLVRAVAHVHAAGIPVRCLLVGDGPDRPRLERLAADLFLGDRLVFLGSRSPEDVYRVLQQASAFVLPSLSEGMSVSVMEAMSLGMPVVATAAPGTVELVIPEETGLLVPLNRPDLLAAAIRRVLQEPGLGARLGAAGRRRIESHFSLGRMIDAYEQLYRRLANERRART